MKGYKRILSLVMVVVLASFAFVGCGQNNAVEVDSKVPAAGSDDEMVVEIVAKGFQHDFWQAVLMGTEKAAEEFGVKTNFVGPEGEGAIATQVSQINNAINKEPDAICLAALDTSAALDAIALAQLKNIPIIGFDSGVPGAPDGAVKANASTDNYLAGALAAEKMHEKIKSDIEGASAAVRIGVISQEANSDSIVKRTSGFVDKMVELIGADKVSVEGHDKFSSTNDNAAVIIEVRIPAEITDNAGKTEALTLLNKEDLISIYGSNEFAAKCIINANEGMDAIGEGKVIAVGFDAGALQLDAIRKGLFYGSITQDPVSIGYNAVRLAVASAKGETVSDVDTGCQWYNAENMEDPAIAPCLYE